ncbi:hypothetical protein Tco_0532012 [Tanacetum coccineum]
MASMKYCDKHNQVGFLKKPEESTGFAEIVDLLKGSHIRYALTHNPTVHDSLVKQFWQTATALTLADGTLELRATIDTLEYTITEASVRSKLQLADASWIYMLPNTEIFEGMRNIGYPTDCQADQAGTQFQPSSSIVPQPHTSQPAPTKSTTTPPTPTELTFVPSSPSTVPEHKPIEHPFEQPSPEHQPSFPRQESDIPQTQAPTHTHEAETALGACLRHYNAFLYMINFVRMIWVNESTSVGFRTPRPSVMVCRLYPYIKYDQTMKFFPHLNKAIRSAMGSLSSWFDFDSRCSDIEGELCYVVESFIWIISTCQAKDFDTTGEFPLSNSLNIGLYSSSSSFDVVTVSAT